MSRSRKAVVGLVVLPTVALLVKAIAVSELRIESTNLVMVGVEPERRSPTLTFDSSTDSVVFPQRTAIHFRNWSFRQGWINRCEVFPLGTDFTPSISNIRVERVPIRPFRTVTVSCDFRVAVPVVVGRNRTLQPKTASEALGWGIALFDQEGKQVEEFVTHLASRPDTPVVPDSAGVIQLPVGGATKAAAHLRTPDGKLHTGIPVSWSSLDPDVAVVTPDGLIAGIAPGLATIRANVGGQTLDTKVLVVRP